MKLIYDGDSLDNLGSGVGRYFRYLMHGMKASEDISLIDSASRWGFVDAKIKRLTSSKTSFTKRLVRKMGVVDRPLIGYDISHTNSLEKPVKRTARKLSPSMT